MYITPIHELRARANAVRAALTSTLLEPAAVDAKLTSCKRDIAFDAQRDFEATIESVFCAISRMYKSIIVRDDMNAKMVGSCN